MPIFNNKFSPKKTCPRKNALPLNTEEPLEDLLNEERTIKLQLGDHAAIFENGVWIPLSSSGRAAHKSNPKSQQKLQEIEEENNMLKLKVEILLDMLTQATAESHLQQREIDKLKRRTDI